MSWLAMRCIARLLVALSSVALLAACTAGQAIPDPTLTPTPRPTPSAQPATPEGTPMVSPSPSPELTLEPTALPAADVVLRIIMHGYVSSGWSTTSLVADGRLTFPSNTGWQVRTLSSVGVERVRAEVMATGLFAESADVPLVLVPDADIRCTDGLGLTSRSTIELATDGQFVTVSWERPHTPVELECHEPSVQRDTLEALLARLGSMDGWLPSDAWIDPTARPLEPHGFRLFTISESRRDDIGHPSELSTVKWPLAGTLMTYGMPVASPPYDQWTVRCAPLSATDAESVLNALTDAGVVVADSSPANFAWAALLSDRSNDRTVGLVLETMRPEESDCMDADLWFVTCWEVAGVQPFGCIAI